MMTLVEENRPVQVVAADGMLRIGINRPEKKNAISRQMYSDLADALGRAEEDATVRVVFIHGTADCFTSGNDLADFVADPPTGEESPVFRFLTTISSMRKPLVAAVNGPAVGIGTTMLLHCDLVYAGDQARFQAPFVNLGLCPEAASTLLLPHLAGYQKAAEILLLGQSFDAAKGCEIGLVNAVFPGKTVFASALAQAQLLVRQPPGAVQLAKQMMKEGFADKVPEVMSEEGRQFVARLRSLEAGEAFTAFFEKRAPDFSAFS